MRTIKFRGKRKSDSAWVHGYFGKDYSERCIISNYLNAPNEAWEVVPETVGQFTGLFDKNNMEIYEGDVLKSGIAIGMPNTGCMHKIGDLFVVVCLPSGYTLMSMPDYIYESRRKTPSLIWNLNNYFLWNYQNHFEVIGNIHDNPELLTNN